MKVSLKRNLQRVILVCCFFLVLYLFAGCTPKMTGAVKKDATITGQTKKLEAAGKGYRGPEYTIAILTFKNKTPSKALGVGEAATDILRTIVKQAGLEPISMTKEEMGEQDRLIELQQTGALKTGKKSASEGFMSVDFRISGAVTAYSEVEEGSDMLVVQSKTQIARVQVDYALVDIASGKTLLAESGAGEYKKKTGGLFGLGSRTTYDTGLRDGALRDALSKAMTSMIEKLNGRSFRGLVLLVEGDDVVIRAGFKSKLDPGTAFTVYRLGKELRDPDTGRVLGRRQKKIGEIVLISHQSDRISDASIKSGRGFKVGDIIKAIQ